MESQASPPPPGIPEKDIRTWSMLCHLAALCGLLVPSVGTVVGPLVVWLVKRNDHPTIDAHGKEALNFQISVFIYTWALGVIGIATTWLLIGFGFLLLAFVAGIVGLVYSVVAAIKVSNGESFRYPLTIRFL
ncbi:MAG: DUF4870 domain-containing protein [Limisphaerales bacterium]